MHSRKTFERHEPYNLKEHRNRFQNFIDFTDSRNLSINSNNNNDDGFSNESWL